MKSRSIILAALLAFLAAPGLAMPEAASPAVEAARHALLAGDGIAAEVELKKALASGASRAEIAAAMGEALLIQGELKRAREWLEPGQFTPDQAAYGWRMLGMLERNEGHLAAAGAAYDRALTIAPKDPLLWVDIGRLRYAGGEQLQAVDAGRRAIASGPDNPRALEFMAQLTRDAHGPQAALGRFERALEAAPDDLSLLGGYAATLGELGRASDMLAVTRRMTELSPHHPYPFYLQAVLAARAGKVELARALLNRTGGKLRNVPAAILLQGVLELEAGNFNLAVELLERLNRQQPGNQRAQLLLTRALYASDQQLELVKRFDSVARRPDAPVYLMTLLARAHENLGNREAAAGLLDRAATITPTLQPIGEEASPSVLALRWSDAQASPIAAAPYVRSLLAANDAPGAVRVAERYLQLRSGSGEALELAGDAQLAGRNWAPALERYTRAAAVRFPDGLMLKMSIAYESGGRGGEARQLVARYLSAFPQSWLATRTAAAHSAMVGDLARSRGLLENLRTRGGNRDARLLADLSLAQTRAGDAASAVKNAMRAWELQRGSSIAAQAYGMALAEQGEDIVLARQLLDKARKTGGDNPLLTASRKKLDAR